MRTLIMSGALLLTIATVANAKQVVAYPSADGFALDWALNDLESGDTLVIMAGHYDSRVRFQNLDYVEVVARGEVTFGAGLEVYDCDDLSVAGLSFHGDGTVDQFGQSTSAVHVLGGYDVSFVDCSFYGASLNGAGVYYASGVAFDRCEFTGMARGVSVYSSSRVSVTRSRFVQQGLHAVVSDQSADSYGLYVARNLIVEANNWAVSVNSRSARVERNVIVDCRGGIGVFGAAAGAVVARNRIESTLSDHGISVKCPDVTLTRNAIRRAARTGILTSAAAVRIVIDRNVVATAGESGIHVWATGAEVTRNRVSEAAAAGFAIDAAGGVYRRNKSVLAGTDGFALGLDSLGATLTRNAAKRSTGFDLRSERGEAEHTLRRNRFSSTSFAEVGVGPAAE